MANEIRVSVNLTITSGKFQGRNSPTSFTSSLQTGTPKGPCPGAITVPIGGKVVSLEELVTPGFCVLSNTSSNTEAYVEYGIYSPTLDLFFPLGELRYGEINLFRFSRNVMEQYEGTGTGTAGPGNRFFMKAYVEDCVVKVEAYES